ncbi:MAG TPA: AraC family transcriptional regulator [Vicinamibacterales bacterium]
MAPAFTDTLVFSSPLVDVGAFRCDVGHPCFRDSGPAEHDLFVFPRTSVIIQHEHERPFVTNPNVVTMYNLGQAYERRPVSARGDYCDWFGVDRSLALDVVRAFDPAIDERADRPFRFSRVMSDAVTYAGQRRLFDRIRSGAAPRLIVEETVVRLLERVVAQSYHGATIAPRAVSLRQRDAVHQAERLLSERFEDALSLDDIARSVDMSPYQLCRAFRSATGRTLGEYRQHLRIRSSLERIRETSDSITEIALGLGYSSHSHFTYAFRREFGFAPSSIRSSAPRRSTR